MLSTYLDKICKDPAPSAKTVKVAKEILFILALRMYEKEVKFRWTNIDNIVKMYPTLPLTIIDVIQSFVRLHNMPAGSPEWVDGICAIAVEHNLLLPQSFKEKYIMS